MGTKITNLAQRFLDANRSEGFGFAFEKSVAFLRAKLQIASRSYQRKIVLSNRIHRKMNGVVGYGVMKGLKLLLSATWGRGDRAGMLLGLYEREVAGLLQKYMPGRSTFIDIGAADGYYAVGMLVAGLCDECVAFEASEKGRASILDLAKINDFENHIKILGAANENTLSELSKNHQLDRSVILCDIEGEEINVFNDNSIAILDGSIIIIELHRYKGLNVDQVEAILRSRAKKYFHVETVKSGARFPLDIPELEQYDEDDKWLICSEGRAYSQSWLVLVPKKC